MARVTKTLDVPGSPKDVFQYLADFSHAAEWDPGVLAAEKATEGPIEVGTAFRLTVAFGPRRLELLYRVTEIEPHRRVVFHCERPRSRPGGVRGLRPVPPTGRAAWRGGPRSPPRPRGWAG
jgi:uncharacterized protein YndB with AHSA1/START domain